LYLNSIDTDNYIKQLEFQLSMHYYNQIAQGYNQLHEDEQLKKLQIIKQHLNSKPTDKILDVGCGTGLSFKFFNNIIGVDPSEEMIKQAEGNVIKARAEQLPFNDKSFDFVLCVTAVHNFDDIEKGLKEIKRVGKRYVITVLRKSEKYDKIYSLIDKMFRIDRIIMEEKDAILFLS